MRLRAAVVRLSSVWRSRSRRTISISHALTAYVARRSSTGSSIVLHTRAGVARLRQLRPGKTSPEQFICISNVLLGCLGGFYLQSAVASLQELEQIEREWRRCFNRFTRRDYTSRALPLYTPSANWKKGRTHLARVGTAALYSAVEKAMSDTEDSPARAAVRSAIALSLHQWGCRSAPNDWRWAHLRKPLEKTTSGKGARFIGDAWMLGCLRLEDGCCPEKSKACRDELLRQARWGRWRGLGALEAGGGGPLRASCPHWQHSSRLLFEPREQGGLGLEFRPLLAQAGIWEVSQMTTNPFVNSTHGGRWLLDKKAVEHRTGRRASAAMWKQWLDVLRVLKRRQVSPPRQDWVNTARLRRYPKGAGSPRGRYASAQVACELRKQRMGVRRTLSVSHYATIFRSAFAPVTRSIGGASAYQGSTNRQARSTTVGWCLDKDESEHFENWEGGTVDLPLSCDSRWPEAAMVMQQTVSFRKGDGWPLDGYTGETINVGDLDRWPPAPQLALRARLILGKEAKAVDRGFGEKLNGVRVAEDVQRDNWLRVCELQSRLAFSHAFATDASEGERPVDGGESLLDEWGWPRRKTSAAAVAHSGEVGGGCLDERLPADSYLGELTALVEALKRAPAGSRVLIVLDSTSPVRAWLRYRSKGARARRQYLAAFGLQLLEEQIRRHELVYFMWQRSHCGSPMNEVADMAAERFRLEASEVIESDVFSRVVADMWPSRTCGNLFSWAVRACEKSVHDHLRSGGAHAVDPEADEWEIGVLQGAVGAAAALLREDRLMVADAGHWAGRRERATVAQVCPLGCADCGGTWYHYLFACQHPKLCEERIRWTTWVHRNRRSFDALCTQNQVTALLSLMPSSNARPRNSLRCTTSDLNAVRRMLCGFVRREVEGEGAGQASRDAVRNLVVNGLRVLCKAVELETEARLRVEKRMRDNRLLLKVVRAWLLAVLKGNPLRVAALRQLRMVRDAGRQAWLSCRRTDKLPNGWSRERFWDVLVSHLARARAEIDGYFPDLGDEAVVWWFLLMKVRGWWSRQPSGFSKTVGWLAWTASLEAAKGTVRRCWRDVGSEVRVRWSTEGLSAEVLPIDSPAVSRIQGGDCDQVSMLARHFEAGRAFFRLGGVRKLRAALRAIRRSNDAARWEAMKIRLDNFRKFGTCSGRAPQPVPEAEKITVIIGKRQKVSRADREWREGARADKRGRWAVDEISAVRKSAEGRGWEVLVLWAGGHDPSWVRLRDLDKGLREEARVLIHETQSTGLTDGAPSKNKRRRVLPLSASSEQVHAAVKRSPRLAEVEARKRKLLTAIVPVATKVAMHQSKKKRSSGMFGVRRAWGLHVRDGVEVALVTWEDEVEQDRSVVPVAWLSEDLQREVRVEAERARTEACRHGPNTMHPFFSRWDHSLSAFPGPSSDGI